VYNCLQGNFHIDTNNYIESWHRHLKEVYLSNMKKLRVDVLLYVLWDLVLPDIMQNHLRSTVELKAKAMSKAERARKRIADSFTGVFIFFFFINYQC
jgi:hypothetical protein